jgi:NADP-dependent 3-hydroxy acid dehydrogenase YdfG
MSGPLAGKVALVTGASRGIGRARTGEAPARQFFQNRTKTAGYLAAAGLALKYFARNRSTRP